MKEQAFTFGAGDALVGIFCKPTNVLANSPVVLLTNAGVLPRQGPHRANVRIARALAELGIASLRFDLAGNGDSLPIGNPAGLGAQATVDIKSAMDWAQRQEGADTFLIFGICSGGIFGFNVALADERVAGLFMFDGYGYRSRWTMPIRHFKRAASRSPGELIAAIRRRLAPTGADVANGAGEQAEERLSDVNPLANPPLPEFVAAMQQLTNRGADVIIAYGGSILEWYSYARQFTDVFGAYDFCPRVRNAYCPDVDHTLLTRHAQQRMVGMVCDWAQNWTRTAASRG